MGIVLRARRQADSSTSRRKERIGRCRHQPRPRTLMTMLRRRCCARRNHPLHPRLLHPHQKGGSTSTTKTTKTTTSADFADDANHHRSHHPNASRRSRRPHRTTPSSSSAATASTPISRRRIKAAPVDGSPRAPAESPPGSPSNRSGVSRGRASARSVSPRSAPVYSETSSMFANARCAPTPRAATIIVIVDALALRRVPETKANTRRWFSILLHRVFVVFVVVRRRRSSFVVVVTR
jgi:hypothetical protein